MFLVIKIIVIIYFVSLFVVSLSSVIKEYGKQKEKNKKIKKIKNLYKMFISILILTVINIFAVMAVLNDRKNIITLGSFTMIVIFTIVIVDKIKK